MSSSEKPASSSSGSQSEENVPLITVTDTDKPAADEGRNNNNQKTRPTLAPIIMSAGDHEGVDKPLLSPAEKVLHILSEKEDPEDEYYEETDIFAGHSVFCQMDMLCYNQDGSSGWKEMSRWLKYEEKVDDGDRWSKPHVSTTSLHSLLKVKQNIEDDETVLMLDVDPAAKSLDKIADINTKQLKPEDVDVASWKSLVNVAETVSTRLQKEKGLSDEQARNVMEALLKSHKHKHRKGRGKKGHHHHDDTDAHTNGGDKIKKSRSFAKKDDLDEMAKKGEMFPSGVRPDDLSKFKPNKKMLRKIPGGAEAASILIGQVDSIDKPISAFVRLNTGTVLADLTEVSLPTRFLYILLSPRDTSTWKEREMGRSMATLLTDKIFCQVAYKGRTRQDIVDGIDEFMDDLTVLPPSIWDPSTRLEPPNNAVSMNAIRKRLDPGYHTTSPDADGFDDHGDEDDSLARTGRLFGGLIKDVKRRYPLYVSDITDAFHTQSIASIFFMFFACITPIVTFGGLMGDKTDQYMGVMETILSGAVCGFLYALFSGQPLTIVGATGPLLVFESIVYTMCKSNEWEFLPFRFWIGIWSATILLIIVMFDLSAVVRYITRFTEESFSVLISLIFIYEAVHKVLHVWSHHPVETDVLANGDDYSCFCVPPGTPNATMPPPTTTTTPMATTSSDLNSSSLNITMDPTTTPIPIFTTFFNWTSKNLPDHCFVHGEKVLLAHDCITSDTECFQHGWSLEGAACSDGAIGHYEGDVAMLSTFLFLGTFGLAYFLRSFRTSSYFPTIIRSTLADFCVLISIVVWTSIDISFGINTDKLIVPSEFKTTNSDRTWLVNPFGMKAENWWLAIMALVPAALATILIFLDQQITAVIVNRKEHKLKKGHGYHLDLFVLAFLIIICSLFGLPWFVAATVRAITHVRSLFKESETKAPGEKPNHIGVREQRVTGIVIHIMIGCSVLLTSILKFIPMSVLYGVFMYMGVTSLSGVQFVERILLFIQPAKYQPDYIYLRHVTTTRIHIFTLIQILCMAGMWIIKMNPKTAIAFPVMLLVLCVVRKLMDYLFTQSELYWLDHLFPDETRRKKEDEAKYALEEGNADVVQLPNEGLKKKGGPLDPEKFETRPRARSIEIIRRYDQEVTQLPEREKEDAV